MQSVETEPSCPRSPIMKLIRVALQEAKQTKLSEYSDQNCRLETAQNTSNFKINLITRRYRCLAEFTPRSLREVSETKPEYSPGVMHTTR